MNRIFCRFDRTLVALSLVLSVNLAPIVSNKVPMQSAIAGGESEFAQGLKMYKARNYTAAAKAFEQSLASGNGSADVYIYMAHSYAASGKTADAVRRYRDVETIFKGLPAANLARKCLERIDPNGQWRRKVANSPSTTSSSGSSSASGVTGGSLSSSQASGLLNRIYLIPPAKGHAPVNPHTVTIVKQTLLSLPRHVFKILDAGGTTINIGPNIIDKWPEAIYGAKPGEERITLSQEAGRTYDRAVYLWECDIDLETERLKPRRSPAKLRSNLIYVLGHAYNDCLGPLTQRDEFKRLYDSDEIEMSFANKTRYRYFLQPGYKGTGDVFCAVFCNLYDGSKYESVLRAFPKSTAYIKSKLGSVHQGGQKPEELIAAKKIEKPPEPKPHQIQRKATTVAHASDHSATSKVPAKAKAPFTEFIPKESKQHYQRAVGDNLFLRGTIEGKDVYWLLDTGAFETIVGKNKLQHLGIETPPGPPTSRIGGVTGAQKAWDMELDITVGDIRQREKVKVAEKMDVLLLGQPFLRDLNFAIDKNTQYITFSKKEEDSKKYVHADSFEIPFRYIDNHIVVITKVNGVGLEMWLDTGAPNTLISGMDNLRLRLPYSSVKGKGTYRGTDTEIYAVELESIELGPIKKRKMPALFQPTWGEKSILGQDFFGHRKHVIDNEKNVIRFTN
ncbi:MAG: retroviral-like aspartic protease family protein [Cyanobacteriota/Melainabacteria group bacterium]